MKHGALLSEASCNYSADACTEQLHAPRQEDTVENTDATSAEGSLVTAIWRLELARARHVLRAYLRTRHAHPSRLHAGAGDPDKLECRAQELPGQHGSLMHACIGLLRIMCRGSGSHGGRCLHVAAQGGHR